ncbi:hypothetical protein ACUH9Y_01220 [Dermabacteraceae bacterium P13115]
MNMNEVWARLNNDEDAQETMMAAHREAGHLSYAAAEELSCGTSAFSTLQALGLTEKTRMDGSLNLNEQGKRLAIKLAGELETGYLRQLALERAVLKVARSLQQGKRIATSSVLEIAEPAKYGCPWSVQEVERVIGELHEDGLVKVLPAQQGTILAGITRKGRAELSPAAQSNSATSTVTDRSLTIIGDNLGNAATGDQVTQTSTVNTLAYGALQHLLDHIDDLPGEVQGNVREQIDAAREELVQDSPDTARAARFLKHVSNTLSSVSGSPKVANFLAVLQLVTGALIGG